ncbi:MAG: hypothetical protein IIT39_03180 [Clostridia bacterium]|nr:hypothetical protein [Clostridia bacterium]
MIYAKFGNKKIGIYDLEFVSYCPVCNAEVFVPFLEWFVDGDMVDVDISLFCDKCTAEDYRKREKSKTV